MTSETEYRGGIAGSLGFLLALPVLLLAIGWPMSALDASTIMTDALALAFVVVPLACLLDWRFNRSPTWVLVLHLMAFIVLQWWFIIDTLNRLAAEAGPNATLLSAPPLESPGAFAMHAVLPVASLIVTRVLLAARSGTQRATTE